ncbi:undecaprenyl-diphosphate phosphatase [Patescibacteria group bacterium]|nr:undecaprenyl-diphosphate phosphatase [Patescibacteria group bacterium]MCL5410130.1 undecaprenyl-diphosphate phosphatase [Patescibacteria group bacterium]
MDLLQTLILSVIEGITEFLPISSTGHLILASDILRIVQTDFAKSFEIFIQLGAILAVVVLYWRRLIINIPLWKKLIAAFIPTGILGLAFYKIIKTYLLGNTVVTLLALLLGGIAIILFEKYFQAEKKHEKIEQMSIKTAFGIGLFQSVSMIPGVSRSAATILGGLFLGLSREQAAEFSFMLAIPTMAAATGLDLVETSFHFTSQQTVFLGVGFIGAFVTALFTVRLFINFIKKHTFIPFGIYRIILAILFWLLLVR